MYIFDFSSNDQILNSTHWLVKILDSFGYIFVHHEASAHPIFNLNTCLESTALDHHSITRMHFNWNRRGFEPPWRNGGTVTSKYWKINDIYLTHKKWCSPAFSFFGLLPAPLIKKIPASLLINGKISFFILKKGTNYLYEFFSTYR